MSVMPRLPRALVTLLIALNTIVYLVWNYGDELGVGRALGPEFMIDNFLVSWDALAAGRYWVLLTSVFSHSNLLHLFMNMFVLNSFGPIVQRTLGARRFLAFYLVAGLVSSLAHALVSAFLMKDPGIPALGASGAISGVVLLFSLLYPKEKILMFAIIPVPAIFGAVLFVALDIWGLVAQSSGGGLPIGHGAHLGGAFAGFLYFLILRVQFKRSGF